MQIRKATKEDFETLCKLRRELIRHQNKINPNNKCDEKKLKSSDNIIKTYLERDYSIFFIAFEDEKAIGFIHGTIDPKPQEHIQAYVQDLFVIDAFRKKGIGSDLLMKLDSFFKEKKVIAGLSTDENNKETIGFYKKRGYEVYKTEDKIAYLIQKISK